MILWLVELSATDMNSKVRIIGLTMLAAMFVLTALSLIAVLAARNELRRTGG